VITEERARSKAIRLMNWGVMREGDRERKRARGVARERERKKGSERGGSIETD